MKEGVIVIGIDSAWSRDHESGFAVVSVKDENISVLKLCSVNFFTSCLTDGEHVCSGIQMLQDVFDAYPESPKLICADIPLSLDGVASRRECDNNISKLFWQAQCSTHSVRAAQCPTVEAWNREFCKLGEICVDSKQLSNLFQNNKVAIIETYPHPAILGLLSIPERLQYKVGKRCDYWRGMDPQQRKQELCNNLRKLSEGLRNAGLLGNAIEIDVKMSFVELKRVEDKLDALVCVWVGLNVLKGNADPVGNRAAAIWLPRESFKMIKPML